MSHRLPLPTTSPPVFSDIEKWDWWLEYLQGCLTHYLPSGVTMREVVVVPDNADIDPKWRGTWFPPDFDWKANSGRFMEMIARRAMIGNVSQAEARRQLALRHATEDEWAFVIGLVVCDLAKRVKF